jgi:outer membrane lipoprotein-sorting protein
MTMCRRRVLVLAGMLAGLCSGASWAADNTAAAGLTAQQIVEKHLAARGGLQAWRGVQSMAWAGKMDAGSGDSSARSEKYIAETWGKQRAKVGAQAMAAASKGDNPNGKAASKQVQLPFVLEMKRPGKSRVELEFAGKTAIQVFDGKGGWMKRPYLNRDDWEPFTPEQVKSQEGKWELDGPLFNVAARGTKVALDGVDKVDGKDAYKLKLTLKNGTVQHVWIDQKSFLDVKVEGIPRQMDGKMHTVWINQRDFRSVQGVMVPFEMETVVDGYADTHKMLLEKVTVNPALDDALFVKPGA